ncbi:MAG: hypothetical protein V4714_08970 [Bacteroidota bacterium]
MSGSGYRKIGMKVGSVPNVADLAWMMGECVPKSLLCLVVWLAMVTASNAQSLELLREVKIQTSVSVSLDRYNRIFVGDEKGNINQYDTLGKVLLTYSPSRVVRFSLIEAWKTTKVFAFSRDLQQYTLLDRFLVPIGQYPLDENNMGFARIATLSADDNLWLFDEVDFSLKKYDWRSQAITINAPMNLVLDTRDYDLNFMREYQNMLFINDRNSGILVFDNLGNYKKKLYFKGLTAFGMLNEELYFLQDNQLRFFHLYNFTERALNLPATIGREIRQVLVFENKVVLFYHDTMAIYQMRN